MPQPLNGVLPLSRLREGWSLPRTPVAIAADLLLGAVGVAILTLPWISTGIATDAFRLRFYIAPHWSIAIMALWAVAGGLFLVHGNRGILPRIAMLAICVTSLIAGIFTKICAAFLIGVSVFGVVILLAAIAGFGIVNLLGFVLWVLLLLYGPMAVAAWMTARGVITARPA